MTDDLLAQLIIDLRRGTLVLVVLCSLDQPEYGYSLLKSMETRGIKIDANTLYPLLRRLESQGLLQSQWDTGESRPRKYYSLSDRGQALRSQLTDEWLAMTFEINELINKTQNEGDIK